MPKKYQSLIFLIVKIIKTYLTYRNSNSIIILLINLLKSMAKIVEISHY